VTSSPDAFHHEAMLFSGTSDFVATTAPLLRDAIARDEPVVIMVDRVKIDGLRAELGSLPDIVHLADMRSIGANPACIIPAWHEFVDEHAPAGRPIRAIGEAVWSGRAPPELLECRQYEALVNLAFAETPSFTLSCAYDVDSLSAGEIAAVRGTHPIVHQGGESWSTNADERLDALTLFAEALSPSPEGAATLAFDKGSLVEVREFVGQHAASALDTAAWRDLVLAVDELAANTVRHGGGEGTVRVWHDGVYVVCEVSDRGHITDPLVGVRRPGALDTDGRGLWLVNHLCELVQLRSGPDGTLVRVYKRAS
jgi:anti-sigma regulatory factor (Ser/Thr protein kinase)